MAANTLSILTPSVNNLTVRILVRAAGLDFEERDVWGKKDEPEFIRIDPAQLTPLLEEEGQEYMSAVELALGDAYSEPAADVRGYIASVGAPA